MPKNEKSKFIWSETRNSNLFYYLGLKTKKANLFGQKLEIQTLLYFNPENEKSKLIWAETRNSNFKPKNEKIQLIWSETRNSNLFYIFA